MQGHRIATTFPTAAADDLVHQIRNFAEDLGRAFRRQRGAVVLNADTAEDQVFIDVISKGRLRQILKVVNSTLVEHYLDHRSSVTVSATSDS